MKDFIQELEKRSNRQKGEWIKSFLRDHGVPFQVQKFRTLLAKGENIIVDYPFNGNKSEVKKTLITAHYNAWFRTPGANDNASGVSVILNILTRLQKEPQEHPIRFVFFDLEDGWAVRGGSKSYVSTFGTDDIGEAYNLEMVGIGENIILWPSRIEDLTSGWLKKLTDIANGLGFKVHNLPTAEVALISFPVRLGFMSDHVSFHNRGFKHSCSITTFPDEDAKYFDRFMQGEFGGKLVLEMLKYCFLGTGNVPKLFKHYHNSQDRSEFVEEKTLEKIRDLIWKTL